MAKPALDLSKLSPGEKLDLIDELWFSLVSDELELSDELRAELDRRLERLARDPSSAASWEEVRAAMRSAR